ncbi:MAG: hypothetical protein RIS47_469 [Bacteroidota bacterium]|jgi:homoserine O-acetyltransferase
MGDINHIKIVNYRTVSGELFPEIDLSYEIFGTAENMEDNAVLVCHALTGNSHAAGPGGWWADYIGEAKGIDLRRYTVIAFNIPGNGYGLNPQIFENYKAFTSRDIAILFWMGAQEIGIKHLYAIIGGSLGGVVAWEMAIEYPDFADLVVPIGSDYKITDWILAHNKVQEQILEHSSCPLHTARMMAMMFYRTPQSFKAKFNRSWNYEDNMYNAESYLMYQGDKLVKRFHLESYKLMNHLLTSHNIAYKRGGEIEALKRIKSRVITIGIDTDIFFVAEENRAAVPFLRSLGLSVEYREICSPHGHDAFLVEFNQLSNLTSDIFLRKKVTR